MVPGSDAGTFLHLRPNTDVGTFEKRPARAHFRAGPPPSGTRGHISDVGAFAQVVSEGSPWERFRRRKNVPTSKMCPRHSRLKLGQTWEQILEDPTSTLSSIGSAHVIWPKRRGHIRVTRSRGADAGTFRNVPAATLWCKMFPRQSAPRDGGTFRWWGGRGHN